MDVHICLEVELISRVSVESQPKRIGYSEPDESPLMGARLAEGNGDGNMIVFDCLRSRRGQGSEQQARGVSTTSQGGDCNSKSAGQDRQTDRQDSRDATMRSKAKFYSGRAYQSMSPEGGFRKGPSPWTR